MSSQESVATDESSSGPEDTKEKKKKEKQKHKSKKTPTKKPSNSAIKLEAALEGSDKQNQETPKKPKKKQKKVKTAKGDVATEEKGKPKKPVFKCKKAKSEPTSSKTQAVQESHVLSEIVEEIRISGQLNEGNTQLCGECCNGIQLKYS